MRNHVSRYLALGAALGAILTALTYPSAAQPPAPPITITADFPNELNPPFVPGPPAQGGAQSASPEQSAAFAWQEFIAANWPAVPQQGAPGQRDTPDRNAKFGDPAYTGPLAWETFRGKVEIFPGNVSTSKIVGPPGYPGPPGDTSFGYDALPVYNYNIGIPACDPNQANDPTPWINLDETDQIGLDNMYAGVVGNTASPGNSAPQLVRFLAKANRLQYTYVTGNSKPLKQGNLWWVQVPDAALKLTKAYLQMHQASPPAGSSTMVSQFNGTIEIKAGWRQLNAHEAQSGRFHTQKVRFYEVSPKDKMMCYVDATWGLISLHIIQKTPSAPFFIYATFEQADNILTADNMAVEDVNGNYFVTPPATATTPQVCLRDPQPKPSPPPPDGQEPTSMEGSVVATNDPKTCLPLPTTTYCSKPGNQLYYLNDGGSPPNSEPSGGFICVNRRENAIPDYVIAANVQAHAAIAAYLKNAGIASSPWLYYKLINVQYYPYDKIPNPQIPNGSPYTAKPPYTAQNPAPSSFYQANIVVETNRSLQLFSGGLSPIIATDWNQDGTLHKNTYYGGHFYNMGGCMGCHGSQGQNPMGRAGDFSVILAVGTVFSPEVPALATPRGRAHVPRNRKLSR